MKGAYKKEKRRIEKGQNEYMQSYSVISDQLVVKCLVVPRISMSATVPSYSYQDRWVMEN